ncbi:heterokaryon incompatibility protein-domain-containing protein [Pisolithus marmoratus]|nr:heterokaryon incompatibility protein-domain-containing protein [Pisolithus marmoratus]
MRLIDVNVLLTGERGTQQDCDIKPVLREFEDTVIDYAILSHRWVPNEVDYTEIITLTKTKNRDEIRGRTGYQKIVNSCKQAKNDGLEWLWVDTCCIDKWNSSELSEALNSMFRWYENSRRCYAYLHDVDGWPEWFSRCWTLPELIAPRELQFFNAVWQPIGDKRALASMLEVITRVPSQVLLGGLASYGPSVAQVMSWAAARRTTRTEDRAYSLLGLLGVNMPMLYGEGKIAFLRLQLEVIRKSNDQTIFAWTPAKLPLRRYPGSLPVLQVTLACRREGSSRPITQRSGYLLLRSGNYWIAPF